MTLNVLEKLNKLEIHKYYSRPNNFDKLIRWSDKLQMLFNLGNVKVCMHLCCRCMAIHVATVLATFFTKDSVK